MEFLGSSPIKQWIMYKVGPGEDLLKSIEDAVERERIDYGFVLALGQLGNVRLAYAKSENEFKVNEIKEPVEITSCFGRINEKDQERKIHVHISVATKDGKVYGGHLLDGSKVSLVAEVIIVKA